MEIYWKQTFWVINQAQTNFTGTEITYSMSYDQKDSRKYLNLGKLERMKNTT